MLSTKTFERLVAFIHVVAFLIPVRRLCFNIYRLSTESVAHSIRFFSTRIFLSFTLLLLKIRSRQPRLYRIIVLHENNNLCWTDSQQLWVLEGLPLICIPAIEKYRYAMRTWRCTLNSVFQLSQRNYGAIYVQVPQPFPNYASLRTFFTNFVHR